jgi:hypothetical protein
VIGLLKEARADHTGHPAKAAKLVPSRAKILIFRRLIEREKWLSEAVKPAFPFAKMPFCVISIYIAMI